MHNIIVLIQITVNYYMHILRTVKTNYFQRTVKSIKQRFGYTSCLRPKSKSCSSERKTVLLLAIIIIIKLRAMYNGAQEQTTRKQYTQQYSTGTSWIEGQLFTCGRENSLTRERQLQVGVPGVWQEETGTCTAFLSYPRV